MELTGLFGRTFRVPAGWLVESVGQVVFWLIEFSLSTFPKVDTYRGVRTTISIITAGSAGRITQGPEPAEEYTEPLIP